MITANQIKQIKSYQQKKFRIQDRVFLAETPKIVENLLHSYLKPIAIYGTSAWWNKNQAMEKIESIEISEKELDRISALRTPNQVLGLFAMPNEILNTEDAFKGCSLILDDIKDPGNMGTILRIADWFGMERILCSINCTDIFQPKCVQSAMGSIGNIHVYYTELLDLLQQAPSSFASYGTFLSGTNIYNASLNTENAWYIIGNEAHGINTLLENKIKERLFIPSFSQNKKSKAESLNASMATAILCSEIKRRN
ncbi:MAG: RNA methyltransferase [Bacteroidales bacterium]